MGNIEHAIHDRVAEVHIVGSHVDFCTEHHLAWLDVAGVHQLEKFQTFLNGSVAIG